MRDKEVSNSPVFIVGMNGSGTTLLLDCLNNHPELYGFPRETRVIPYFVKTVGKYGDLRVDANFRKLWVNFLKLSFFKYLNGGIDVPLPRDWAEAPRSVAGVVDGAFRYFASKEGKIRWCEKTPMHAQHISLLSNAFPKAKFIHIIRDGRACAASFHRRWKYTPELTIYRWKFVIREARRQALTIDGRYLEVRYEDLTGNPEACMSKICDFLEIEFDENVMVPSRVREYTGSTSKVITNFQMNGWSEYFSSEKRYKLEDIAGTTLDELGYKVKGRSEERDPPLFLVKYWSYRDLVRQGVTAVKEDMKQRSRGGKWVDLSGRIVNALRQRITNKR